MRFRDRLFRNPKQRKFKIIDTTNDIMTVELQDDPGNIIDLGVAFNDANMELFRKDLQIDITTDAFVVKTGRIIDGKDEYVKRMSLGALPNAVSRTIPNIFGGVNLVRLTKSISGRAIDNVTGIEFSLPFSHPTAGANIAVYYNHLTDILTVYPGTDRSSLIGEIELYFTYNKE